MSRDGDRTVLSCKAKYAPYGTPRPRPRTVESSTHTRDVTVKYSAARRMEHPAGLKVQTLHHASAFNPPSDLGMRA